MGVEQTPNKSQHSKFTLKKATLLLVLVCPKLVNIIIRMNKSTSAAFSKIRKKHGTKFT